MVFLFFGKRTVWDGSTILAQSILYGDHPWDDITQIDEYEWHMNEDCNTMRVIGIIGDEGYHIWFPVTGEYGFARHSNLTTGNG